MRHVLLQAVHGCWLQAGFASTGIQQLLKQLPVCCTFAVTHQRKLMHFETCVKGQCAD